MPCALTVSRQCARQPETALPGPPAAFWCSAYRPSKRRQGPCSDSKEILENLKTHCKEDHEALGNRWKTVKLHMDWVRVV